MEAISEIAAALVSIQQELKNPALDSTNPHYRNKYPSLAGVRDTIVPIAAKHGVAVLQNLVTNENGVGCETILVHKSGQSLKFGPLYLPASKHDPQGFGSCATYARRYSLLAAFNVVGDEDDDANAGTEAHKSLPTQTPSAGHTQSNGHDVVPTGKYRGKPWTDVATDYLQWVINADRAPADLKEGAQREIERRDAERGRLYPTDFDDGSRIPQ